MIETTLQEKIGATSFNRAKIIAESRFGEKQKLKNKFYQSVIEGHINIDKEWVDESTIKLISESLQIAPDSRKKEIISSIMDTYDTTQPQVKAILVKYKKYL
jgi:hypothetical protein